MTNEEKATFLRNVRNIVEEFEDDIEALDPSVPTHAAALAVVEALDGSCEEAAVQLTRAAVRAHDEEPIT